MQVSSDFYTHTHAVVKVCVHAHSHTQNKCGEVELFGEHKKTLLHGPRQVRSKVKPSPVVIARTESVRMLSSHQDKRERIIVSSI